MKVVAYSIQSSEKEPLAIANHKKHEITLISNALAVDTVGYAAGKDAVIVYTGDDVSADVIHKLADLGVRFIATRTTDSSQIDQAAAALRNIKIANVPLDALQDALAQEMPMILASETINNLDRWQGNKCLGSACICSRSCNEIHEGVHTNAAKPHGHQ